jgi:hypothetical protein
LYGLYKQATEGDIPGIVPRPGIEEDEAVRAKWYSLSFDGINRLGTPGILNEVYPKQKLRDGIFQV